MATLACSSSLCLRLVTGSEYGNEAEDKPNQEAERTAGKTSAQFSCGSPEQIAESIERLGLLRGEPHEGFKPGMARAKCRRHRSVRPVIDAAGGGGAESSNASIT